jgi:hypothetical protein
MPVRIRDASAVVGLFGCPAGAAQQLVDYSGLRVLEHRPDRALVGLLHVRYVEGDLGRYDELGVAVVVRRHDDPAPTGRGRDLWALASRRAGLFIHRLPVDGEFTMAAGRQIWGFPKVLADFDVQQRGAGRRVVLRQDGRAAVDLTVRPGLPLPAPGLRLALRAYTCLDGVTRFTDWTLRPHGLRGRPGGATVRPGDHPLGRELARLGLSGRALVSASMAQAQMTFGDARTVG